MERVVNILLVEDDVLDAIDIRRTLDKLKILYHLNVASNGETAIEFLNNSENATPDIVLIDINMPRMNGLELLSIIRRNPQWKDLKSFIITTSDEKPDKEAAVALNVSGYIVKPLKLNNAKSIDSLNLMVDLVNLKK